MQASGYLWTSPIGFGGAKVVRGPFFHQRLSAVGLTENARRTFSLNPGLSLSLPCQVMCAAFLQIYVNWKMPNNSGADKSWIQKMRGNPRIF